MPSLAQRSVAECLGTAFLLAGVVGSGIMAAKLSGGNGALALLCNTLPTGAILTVLILTFGPVSGAHFNPAVSIAMALRRELPAEHGGRLHRRASDRRDCWRARPRTRCLNFRYGKCQRTCEQVRANGSQKAVATFGLLLTILDASRGRLRPFLMRWASTSPQPIGSRPRLHLPIRR